MDGTTSDKQITAQKSKKNKRHLFLNHTKLAIGITTALIGGYAGRVHAGSCTVPGPSSVCSGATNAVTDVTQTLVATGGDLTVTTNAGFGINTTTTGGTAIDLIVPKGGTENIIFTDNNSSPITSSSYGYGDAAIRARNIGTGSTSITTSGNIKAGEFGIYASSFNYSNTATPISITTMSGSTITGTNGAILANALEGDITITNNATIPPNSAYGIVAYSSIGNITITTGATITTTNTGVYAALSAGIATITVGGNISSSTDDGIRAKGYSLGNNSVTITGAGDISGGSAKGDDGIDASAQGEIKIDVNGVITGDPGITATSVNGPISITGTGNVNANPGHGINAYISGKGAKGDITIARDGNIDAKGAGDGIHVVNAGTGDNVITVTKAITPDTGIGIVSENIPLGVGADTFITLNAGADVQGGISNNAGDSTTTVNTGAALSGPVTLKDGSDSLSFSGGSFAGITLLDGGDDIATADGFTDNLIFNGSSGFIDAAIVTNWERILLDVGSSIDFIAGAANKTLTTGVLDNGAGTLNMVNGAKNQLTVTGDYGGGGTLAIEAALNAGGTNDTLIINGDVIGTTTLTITDLGNGSGSATVGNGMLVVRVDGASPAGAFTLAAPVRAGDYLYDLVQVGKNWYLQSQLSPLPATPQNIPSLSQWGQILLVSLLGLLGLFGAKRRIKPIKSKH